MKTTDRIYSAIETNVTTMLERRNGHFSDNKLEISSSKHTSIHKHTTHHKLKQNLKMLIPREAAIYKTDAMERRMHFSSGRESTVQKSSYSSMVYLLV